MSLKGKVCLVAGATRGAGRGIARMLGEQHATVYCTGRSSRATKTQSETNQSDASTTKPNPFDLSTRPETIEDTADMVTAHGGIGIPVQCDHTDEQQVQQLIERIRSESKQLDVVVNDIWGGEHLTQWGKPLWEQDISKGKQMIDTAIFTHVITSRYAIPLMIESTGHGLVVEVTDGNTSDYRGDFFYDMVKHTVIRMAFTLAQELKQHSISVVALTPGFLRSEAMLEHFGVTEQTYTEANDPNYKESETPCFVGRAVAALASDKNIATKSGGVYTSWDLSVEYGFTDIDGSKPHWGNHMTKIKAEAAKKEDNTST